MGADYRRADTGTDAERPRFDEVARGYDPRQVEEYLATLWRYASQVTRRAAAAEAALQADRRRREDETRLPDRFAAQAGGRIGLMLTIAQQEADEIVTGARCIAEQALEEAVEDAAANHPIVRKAREQADKLLLDAVEESRQRARQRCEEIETQIERVSGILEGLRHQQGEVLGALLRVRSLMGSGEIDRAVMDLARAGTTAATGPAQPSEQPGAYMPTEVHSADQGVTYSHSAHEPVAHKHPAGGSAPEAAGGGAGASFFIRASTTASSTRPAYRGEDDIIDAEIVEE